MARAELICIIKYIIVERKVQTIVAVLGVYPLFDININIIINHKDARNCCKLFIRRKKFILHIFYYFMYIYKFFNLYNTFYFFTILILPFLFKCFMSFFAISFIRVFLSKNLYSILYFNIPYRFEHTCPHVLLETGGLRILSEIRQYLALGANDVDISNFLVEIQEAWFHKVHDQYGSDKKVLLKKERILQTIHSRTIIRYPRSGHAKTYKCKAE